MSCCRSPSPRPPSHSSPDPSIGCVPSIISILHAPDTNTPSLQSKRYTRLPLVLRAKSAVPLCGLYIPNTTSGCQPVTWDPYAKDHAVWPLHAVSAVRRPVTPPPHASPYTAKSPWSRSPHHPMFARQPASTPRAPHQRVPSCQLIPV